MSSAIHPELPSGRYRHYKGKEYRVLDLARHSETGEWMVIYHTLYGDFGLWVRPLTMFTETVTLEDGRSVPRFELLEADEADVDTD